MNIAIVVSISEYIDPKNNLPGCKKDSDLIYNILSKTKKFEEILYIHEKLSSAKIKDIFTDFISKPRADAIEELFFYYTGHGEFQGNEFYYILSDYNSAKKKQTTLQNEEVDNLFRTLNPNLVVKVIDACQSGKSYIKEADAVDKYFHSTKKEFNKCYFLNSSLKDQSSFQSDIISDFTSSFVKSIKEHNINEIRYKDIIDYISDEFSTNPSQTPFFVIQANYTEKFCTITPELKDYLNSSASSIITTISVKQQGTSLLEKIAKEAEGYLTEEQAHEVLQNLKTKIESFTLRDDLTHLYDLYITFDTSYDEIVDKATIGKWLDENPNNFFAHSVSNRERKDRHTNPFFRLSPVTLDIFKNNDDYEWVRTGFNLSVEVPYKTIIISLDSKFPNLESYTARIVYVLSKKLIRFFYFITNLEQEGWDSELLNTKVSWSTNECMLHHIHDVEGSVEAIFNQLQDKIMQQLEERFKDIDNTEENL